MEICYRVVWVDLVWMIVVSRHFNYMGFSNTHARSWRLAFVSDFRLMNAWLWSQTKQPIWLSCLLALKISRKVHIKFIYQCKMRSDPVIMSDPVRSGNYTHPIQTYEFLFRVCYISRLQQKFFSQYLEWLIMIYFHKMIATPFLCLKKRIYFDNLIRFILL